MRDISVAFEKIKEAISHAQEKHKRAADKHRRSLAFKEDDWVLLRFTKARLHHTTGKNTQEEPTGHQNFNMKLAERLFKPYKGDPPTEQIQEEPPDFDK